MKTKTFLAALGLVLWMPACQKEDVAGLIDEAQNSLKQTDDRCGCMAPVEFQVQTARGTTATISWKTMPETQGYQLELSDPSLQGPDVILSYLTESPQITLSGLTPHTEYRFRVQSLCRSSQASENSTWIQFNSGGGRPGKPGNDKPVKTVASLNRNA